MSLKAPKTTRTNRKDALIFTSVIYTSGHTIIHVPSNRLIKCTKIIDHNTGFALYAFLFVE